MKRIKILSIFFLIACSLDGYASRSMRRCMLLPITDSVGGAIGFKVFESTEKFLKESRWCYYQSNSELINILGNYKKNLKDHLNNPKVLEIVSEKTDSGSMIRIDIENQVEGSLVKIDVIGENGTDVYFKEETTLKSQEAEAIAEAIKNWLDLYEKRIPYDGRVIGVLGDQFTVDIGEDSYVRASDRLEIVRPVLKKRHPLLKEIVDWDTKKIADGRIYHVRRAQSQGKVTQYESELKVAVKDWVKIVRTMDKKSGAPNDENQDFRYGEVSKSDFGKLGYISLYGEIGPASHSYIYESYTAKIGGLLMGVGVEGQLWATRNFWAGFEIARKFGSFDKESTEGTAPSELKKSNNITRGVYKFTAGYKYLPMGFFYGPQVDAYLGYGLLTFGADNRQITGLVDHSLKGLLVGLRGSIPFYNVVRFSLEFEMLFRPAYREDVITYRKTEDIDTSTSSYHIEIGASYIFGPTVAINGAFSFTGSNAKFGDSDVSNDINEVSHSESLFKAGLTFTF